MRTVVVDGTFGDWRSRSRDLLRENVHPAETVWEDGGEATASLFGAVSSCPAPARPVGFTVQIPKRFVDTAGIVACHRWTGRWALLYRIAWRLTRGGERHLLDLDSDADLERFNRLGAAVRRDRHKMKAFVRFRKVRGVTGDDSAPDGCYVAWFEPEHRTVELTAPFFAKRFASMHWSILTPDRCAHWDGSTLLYSDGVTKDQAPSGDELEDYWRTYYASIFNPARLKLDAMRSEMPVKYWKNLPEAPLIAELSRSAKGRSNAMMESPVSKRTHVSGRTPPGLPPPELAAVDVFQPDGHAASRSVTNLDELRQVAESCRACPLCERATQVVFGEGPVNADLMIVGEQPGDNEDLEGRPFVGPSGDLLGSALHEAGTGREDVYLTNVVKHFKWKRRGKRRLHQNPSKDEIHACRPWVVQEISMVKPKVLVCLGATAARALIRPDFALLADRGRVDGCRVAPVVFATFHPSYLLRLPEGMGRRKDEFDRWVSDLKMAVASL